MPSALTELKDLHAGVERSEVIEKFGQPVSHGIDAYGIPVEVFQFVESAPALNSKPISEKKRAANENNKAEVTVLMAQTGPFNGQFAGDLLTVQVSYDEENLIDDTRLLKAVPGPTPH
ncbi:hypothetical protein [Rariglobus hedericola]|uniref:Uncharacterized protein n=1 Tax=Rariglobus hedericola TaxID=2597822 RepID=A0A556QN03_9BACT|nr:hypothetical protein [Rariglobus hedericola]TSJ78013.1 hypothetical protein FPL22_01505 [Rariglobus hedericola]